MLQRRRLPTISVNDHQTSDCPIVLLTRIPLVQAPLLDHIQQGPSFHIALQEVPSQGTRRHLEPINGIPPPNGWAIRMKESVGGTVPLVGGKQLRRVEHSTSTCHPCSQQFPKRHHQNVPKSTAHRDRTTSHPEPGGRDEQPLSRTKGATIKGMANTGHPSAQPSGQQSRANGVPMEEGPRGMARCKELIAAIWIGQIGPKTQPLSNQKGCLPCGISAMPPASMDHTPHLPCLTSNPLCANKRTRRKLLEAPT